MRQLFVSGVVPLSVAAMVCLAACNSGGGPSGDSSRSSAASPLIGKTPVQSRAPDTDKPRVVSWPKDLQQFYPDSAEDGHVDGLVRITVTLDKAGRATDTHIVSEAPPDLGFGAAASTLAHAMGYTNPTGHATTVTFNVKFSAPAAHLSRLQRKLRRLR